MKISIVVPAFNEEKLIAETLRAINAAREAFTPAAWESELIVCDNNSTDRTAELARAAGATVVFEPVNQIARARNCGAAAATGDWIIFVDADSQPTRELFADVVEQIRGGRCLAGGVTVRLDPTPFVVVLVIGSWNAISRVMKWAAGSFIYCETAAFREVGGFSNELFVSEELDLSIRLKKLARRKGRRMVILTRHPLLTSARKLHLYSHAEHAWFMLKTVLTGGRTLRARDKCEIWYDGRR